MSLRRNREAPEVEIAFPVHPQIALIGTSDRRYAHLHRKRWDFGLPDSTDIGVFNQFQFRHSSECVYVTNEAREILLSNPLYWEYMGFEIYGMGDWWIPLGPFVSE